MVRSVVAEVHRAHCGHDALSLGNTSSYNTSSISKYPAVTDMRHGSDHSGHRGHVQSGACSTEPPPGQHNVTRGLRPWLCASSGWQQSCDSAAAAAAGPPPAARGYLPAATNRDSIGIGAAGRERGYPASDAENHTSAGFQQQAAGISSCLLLDDDVDLDGIDFCG